jgi:aspartate beta-hydroxylase
MRVGDQTLEWKRGRCLVFDDSFEHEVWHMGSEPRVVLLADLPHPQAKKSYVIEAGDIGRRIEEFMASRGLSRISRDSNGELILHPDAQHNRMMQKWIAELGVDSFALNGSGGLARDHRR